MDLSNIIIFKGSTSKDGVQYNSYEADFTRHNELKLLTSENVKEFFDAAVFDYIEGKDISITEKTAPTSPEDGLVKAFVDTFKAEWLATKAKRDSIKSKVDEINAL